MAYNDYLEEITGKPELTDLNPVEGGYFQEYKVKIVATDIAQTTAEEVFLIDITHKNLVKNTKVPDIKEQLKTLTPEVHPKKDFDFSFDASAFESDNLTAQ